jgi:hypothetical protein
MTVNEELVREAISKINPADRGDVLSVVEGYRLCVALSQKLRRQRSRQNQSRQVLECAEYCESVLVEYAATGALGPVEHPMAGVASVFHLTISTTP